MVVFPIGRFPIKVIQEVGVVAIYSLPAQRTEPCFSFSLLLFIAPLDNALLWQLYAAGLEVSRVFASVPATRSVLCRASVGLRFMHYFLGECVTRRGIPFIFALNGWDREIPTEQSIRGTFFELLLDHRFLRD